MKEKIHPNYGEDRPGIFSGVTDGFESLVTPDMLEGLTPAALDELLSRPPQSDGTAVGKLITDSTWEFVCALSEEEAGELTEGKKVSVQFSRDWSGTVEMRVERIGAPQDGRVVVILSSDRFLSDTTLLRKQTVDLVFSSTSGIRVPVEAIRTEQRTETDQETGRSREVQITGVYAVVGIQAEFKQVEVLDQRDGYCVVRAVTTGSARNDKKALRSGDQVIVKGRDLFDGKVIQ